MLFLLTLACVPAAPSEAGEPAPRFEQVGVEHLPEGDVWLIRDSTGLACLAVYDRRDDEETAAIGPVPCSALEARLVE